MSELTQRPATIAAWRVPRVSSKAILFAVLLLAVLYLAVAPLLAVIYGALTTVRPGQPSAGLTLDNRNFTDIRTYGLRAEARKLLTPDVTLTYGVDGFEDNSEGRDNNRETIAGFGPPMVSTSNAPSIPHASFRSLGAFVQAEVEVAERVTLVAGGR